MIRRRGGPPRAVPSVLLGLTASLAIGLWLGKHRFTTYEIAGNSMLPSLSPGDYVIVDRGAYRSTPPRPGQIALAQDPRDPRRALVKRVGWIDPDGRIWLLGDQPDESTDSLSFGPVAPDLIIGRVRWRYWGSTGPGRLSWCWVSLSPRTPGPS